MNCEFCEKTIHRNWGDSVITLCKVCANSDEGKELLANNPKSDASQEFRQGTQFNELDLNKSTNLDEASKKWGESIESSLTSMVWGVFIIWLIIMLFGDIFKVTKAKRGKLRGAIHAVQTVADKSFPGANVRIEPRFGGNLRLYIARDHFENVPDSNRPDTVARIGKAWCSHIQQKYFLPSFSVRDMRNANKLASYNCVYPNLFKSLPW